MVEVVKVEDLTVKYENLNESVLNGVSFSIDRGEIVLIAGPTGSGKTTLAFCLSGIIPHVINAKVEGFIRVCDIDPRTRPPKEIARRVGLVLQNPENQIVSSIVWKDVAFSLRNINYPEHRIEEKVQELLETVGLHMYKDFYTNWLSDGQKQRLAIASILALEPEVLILDEPTSTLDILCVNDVLRTLKKIIEENFSTVIVIEHRISRLLNLATRVILLNSGKIVFDGSPDELLKRGFPETLKEKLRNPLENPISYINTRNFDHSNRKVKVEAKNIVVEEDGIKILKNVNLEIFEGEILAITGPNGSGKSTLACVLAGLIKPRKGTVFIDGVNINKLKAKERVKKVGYVFQNPDLQIFTMKVYDEVAFCLRNLGFSEDAVRERVERALRLVNLWKFKDKSPYILSRGQKRKLTLASVLALQPDVLILDEITTGLDEESLKLVENIINSMRSEGRTVILITHDMPIVSRCADRVCFLRNGEVAWVGNVREFFNKEVLRRLWYGNI